MEKVESKRACKIDRFSPKYHFLVTFLVATFLFTFLEALSLRSFLRELLLRLVAPKSCSFAAPFGLDLPVAQRQRAHYPELTANKVASSSLLSRKLAKFLTKGWRGLT